MATIEFSKEGCSTVALCVSQYGEEQLKDYFGVFSLGLDADHLNALRSSLFQPEQDEDTEIHTKEGSVLRVWSRCKWTHFNIVAHFIRSLEAAIPHEDFLFCRIGSENLQDTVQVGSFFDNPFRLWVQRRFVILDDAGLVCTTMAEKREQTNFQSFWVKEAA